MPKQISRRRFLNRITAQTAAAGMFLPALAGRGYAQPKISANDRITLGFIGVGGMGTGQLRDLVHHPEIQILACCDVYEPHRLRAKERVDETYGNTDCDVYKDYRELLARDDIDSVLIATPDHWHTLIATAACQAGKDVYCQKPLTLCIDEGKELVKTVRRYGTVFQVGSQQRSSSNFRFACELVLNGRIGKLQTVTAFLPDGYTCGWDPDTAPPEGLDWDFYLGPAPKVPFNNHRFLGTFRWFYDYSGGQFTDWGAHHLDIAQWGMGTQYSGPLSAEGTGVRPVDGLYETFTDFNVTYEYPNGVRLIATTPERGTKFEGTDGWIQVWRGGIDAEPKDLLRETLGTSDIHLFESPGHEQNWIDCMRSRERPLCDVEIGHRSISVAHLGNIAMRLGRKVHWDPVKEEFIGDEEANRWLMRPYRKPWAL